MYASNLSSVLQYIRGLVGLVDSASSIEASFSTGIVKVTKGDNVGGLVGTLHKAQASRYHLQRATLMRSGTHMVVLWGLFKDKVHKLK